MGLMGILEPRVSESRPLALPDSAAFLLQTYARVLAMVLMRGSGAKFLLLCSDVQCQYACVIPRSWNEVVALNISLPFFSSLLPMFHHQILVDLTWNVHLYGLLPTPSCHTVTFLSWIVVLTIISWLVHMVAQSVGCNYDWYGWVT